MSFLPIFCLAVAVILVAVMPWHRPHPNHLFFVELLRNHLRDESELSVIATPDESQSADTIAAA